MPSGIMKRGLRFVDLSLYRFIALSLCRFVALSPWGVNASEDPSAAEEDFF